jgi:hypothetical protein
MVKAHPTVPCRLSERPKETRRGQDPFRDMVSVVVAVTTKSLRTHTHDLAQSTARPPKAGGIDTPIPRYGVPHFARALPSLISLCPKIDYNSREIQHLSLRPSQAEMAGPIINKF